MSETNLRTLVDHLHSLSGESDRCLLERFVSDRDEAAFASLVRRHGALVQGVCWRVLRHEQDVEDAFQATFLVLAKKATSVRWAEAIGGWLHGTAWRVASALRARRQRRRLEEQKPRPADAGPTAGWEEMTAALDEELAGLPESFRSPLLLCYLQARTRDQAARELGWSLRTLKRRLTRSLVLLRQRLARRRCWRPRWPATPRRFRPPW